MPSAVSKQSGFLDIRDFGAEPVAGFDNAPAIMAALDQAQANGGATVYVPPGVWDVQAPGGVGDAAILRVGEQRVSLRGHTAGASILRSLTPDNGIDVIAAVDCDHVDIRDLGIDGNATAYPATVGFNHALDLRGCVNVVVDRCHLQRTGNVAARISYYGTQLGAGSDQIPDGSRFTETVSFTNNVVNDAGGTGGLLTKIGGAREITVVGNVFERVGIAAISIEAEVPGGTPAPGGRVIVAGNIVTHAESDRVTWGILVTEFMSEITITGNVVEDIEGTTLVAGIGVSTSPNQDDTPVRNATVVGNTIRSVGQVGGRGVGVYLSSGVANLENVSVGGNVIEAVDNGIELVPVGTGAIVRPVIVGNEIDANTWGIRYGDGTTNTVPIEQPTVAGNTIRTGSNDGVRMSANLGSIVGNSIDAGNGVAVRLVGGADTDVNGNTTPDAVLLNGVASALQIGEHWLWVDGTGDVRVDGNRPTAATYGTAGVVVGTQV